MFVRMSDDERDIDVELDDGDLGGVDEDGNSIIWEDGIPENKRSHLVASKKCTFVCLISWP